MPFRWLKYAHPWPPCLTCSVRSCFLLSSHPLAGCSQMCGPTWIKHLRQRHLWAPQCHPTHPQDHQATLMGNSSVLFLANLWVSPWKHHWRFWRIHKRDEHHPCVAWAPSNEKALWDSLALLSEHTQPHAHFNSYFQRWVGRLSRGDSSHVLPHFKKE